MIIMNILCRLFLVIEVTCGFLLQHGNELNGNRTEKYITVESFLEFKNHIGHVVEQMQKTVEQSLGVLSSQLDGKFLEIDNKISARNSSMNNLGAIINELSENFTDLQDAIGGKLSALQLDSSELQKKSQSLVDANINIRHMLDRLNHSTGMQAQINTTKTYEECQLLRAKTENLEQNLIARGQDMIALITKVDDMAVKMDRNNEKVNDAWKDVNETMSKMSSEIMLIEQKVAITACAKLDQDRDTGYVVLFDDIKTNIGFGHTASFISNGKFICEHDGIYHVYVTIDAYNTGINYNIMVNGARYVNVFENDNKVTFQRCNIAVALNLKMNDNVWIELSNHVMVSYFSSCLTIVKVK